MKKIHATTESYVIGLGKLLMILQTVVSTSAVELIMSRFIQNMACSCSILFCMKYMFSVSVYIDISGVCTGQWTVKITYSFSSGDVSNSL